MTISKIRFNFYRENTVKSFAGFTSDKTITIHQVINSKTGYDPFEMRKKGTKRNNTFNLLRSYNVRYAKGRESKAGVYCFMATNKYLEKYSHNFK